MKLWIGNIAPGTSDEELKELVHKYAPDLICESVKHEEGDGTRPGAILEVTEENVGTAEQLSQRLNGMYWKQRELICFKMVVGV